MRRALILAAIGSFSLLATGCGGSTSDDAQSSAESAASETASEPAAEPTVKSDGRTPQEVVQILMTAMVANDQVKLDSMVTAKTRTANAFKADIKEQEAVRFTVGDVEMKGEDQAYVASAWFFPGVDGGEERMMTLWKLRREPEGFRVYGSVMIVPQLAKYDGGKVEFDFEDAEQVAETENRAYELLMQEAEAARGPAVAKNLDDQPGTARQ